MISVLAKVIVLRLFSLRIARHIIIDTPLTHPWSILDTPLTHPWHTVVTSLTHPNHTLDTPLLHSWHTLDTYLIHPWHTLDTPLWNPCETLVASLPHPCSECLVFATPLFWMPCFCHTLVLNALFLLQDGRSHSWIGVCFTCPLFLEKKIYITSIPPCCCY